MSRFMRLFSGRWNVPSPDQSSPQGRQGSTIICQVRFLDGTQVDFDVPKRAYGSVLYQKVFNYMDLVETDYFGLQFTDQQDINRWLEVNKPIKKQVFRADQPVIRGSTAIFYLKVKFYSSQPSNLKEEITRYQVFLQVKQDLLSGKLPCPFETAVELAALVLQSELGDFDPSEHTAEMISEFRFVPNQTKDLEKEALEKYKSCKGMSPGLAEMTYLNKARWLELYGVDFHVVQGRDGNNYTLGLVPAGILVFENFQRIGLFYWPKITQLQFKKKKIILDVVEGDDKGVDQEHTFIFRCSSDRACKNLWKCAVEHHGFFRLSGPSKPVGMKHSFLRIGSRFRYSGNTELQSLTSVRARKSVSFERKQSQRMSRRGDPSRQSSVLRQSLRGKPDQEPSANISGNNNVDGYNSMKRAVSTSTTTTGNGTLNRPRGSRRFNIPSDTSSEPHHHSQQQQQQLQPSDLEVSYRRRQILSSTQVSNDQRPRTRSTEPPRIRSQVVQGRTTAAAATTTTTTTTNTPLDLSASSKRGVGKSETTKNHPFNDSQLTKPHHESLAFSKNSNNSPARTLSPRNEIHGHLNSSSSNDKRISEKLKKEPFNRRGDPRFQSTNMATSSSSYNTDGLLKKPRKTFSTSNMMDVTPSDVYGPQKPKVDWLKSTTNHTASPPLVNPEIPQQNNFKENHNKAFHSSLQKRPKFQPPPLQVQGRIPAKSTPAKHGNHDVPHPEQTTHRLPLTSSSSHNQHLNHPLANYSLSSVQQPIAREIDYSPSHHNPANHNPGQSARIPFNQHLLIGRTPHEQHNRSNPSPFGYHVYDASGQMVAKQQAPTRRVVQRDERSKSVVILTTEV